MVDIVQEICSILVSGITSLGSGIASGVKTFAQALFLDTAGGTTSLSTFGGLVAVFGGIALATGLTYAIFSWIKSLGAR